MLPIENYLRVYFGSGSEYYLEKYAAFYEGKRFTFNIGPFLFGGLWFLYRKLWSEAIIIILFQILLGMLENHYYKVKGIPADMQFTIMAISTLVLGTMYGFTGNYFYVMKADRSLHEILSLTADETDRQTFLKGLGGTSYLPFAVCGIAVFLLMLSGRS